MRLKNLFSRKSTPSINSIEFDNFKWNLEENTPHKKTWTSNEESALLAIHYFENHPPDLPARLDDVNTSRIYYRNMIVTQVKGGLIHFEAINLKGYDVIEMIVKQPMPTSGMAYNGSLTILFKKHNFIIKLQAIEAGVTGIREAIILDRLMGDGVAPEIDENGKMIGWSKDPYDDDFKKGKLMNYAEREEFDVDFPHHPLSTVRNRLKQLKQSISFGDELKKFEKF